jgi:hypothetical protein
VENIEKCEDISEQERIILALIFGKIKNDLEKVGDIDKLLNGGANKKFFDAIAKTPAADVVEVVRCKDCRSYEPHGNGKAGRCRNPKCKGLHWANDFCSYGERKE